MTESLESLESPDEVTELKEQVRLLNDRISVLESAHAHKPGSASAAIAGKVSSYVAALIFALILWNQSNFYQDRKGDEIPIWQAGPLIALIALSLGVNVPPELLGKIFVK